jgi:cyclopropane fatty-acyl-phospholipid synthase-like methyltransferase
MTSLAHHFDHLYRANPDPWGYRDRWYEKRKRAVTLGALPKRRYRAGFEPGCSIGELSIELAARCDLLVAWDASVRAVASAQARLRDLDNVRVQRGSIPHDWPRGSFDLVVVSEVAYYLSATEVHHLARRLRDSLAADGTVVACHWRHQVPEATLSVTEIHSLIRDGAGLARIVNHAEDDFLLEVWSTQGKSVARRKGLA